MPKRSEAPSMPKRSEAPYICRSEARCHICQSTTWMHRHLPVQPITVTKQKRISSVAIFAQVKSVRGRHSRHRRREMFSERPCPHHGGHRYFALRYEEDTYEKLKFGDWEKECIACSLQCKLADAENQQITIRPWEASQELANRASLRSETKQDFSEIGISLHKGKPKNYNIQFVCKACRTATNVLYPVAAAQDKRDEADQTMLGIFEPFFDLVGPIWTKPTLAPRPPPPPPPPSRREFDSAAKSLIQSEDEEWNQIQPTRPKYWGRRFSTSSAAIEDKSTTASVVDGYIDDASVTDSYSTIPFDLDPPYPKKPYRCYWHNARQQEPIYEGHAQYVGHGEEYNSWTWTGPGWDDWQWDVHV